MACVLWPVGLLFLKMYKNKWAKLLPPSTLKWFAFPPCARKIKKRRSWKTKDARANFSHFMGNVFSWARFFFFFGFEALSVTLVLIIFIFQRTRVFVYIHTYVYIAYLWLKIYYAYNCCCLVAKFSLLVSLLHLCVVLLNQLQEKKTRKKRKKEKKKNVGKM